MKTIKQWLNTLQEPYKNKALNQTNESLIDSEVPTLILAMYTMFNWEESFEGDLFWREYVESLENIEK